MRKLSQSTLQTQEHHRKQQPWEERRDKMKFYVKDKSAMNQCLNKCIKDSSTRGEFCHSDINPHTGIALLEHLTTAQKKAMVLCACRSPI